MRFIEYAERIGAEYVNAETFIGWRESFGDAGQHTWARRFGIVRIFAQWLHELDLRHDVFIPPCQRRSRPYICSSSDIRVIVEIAATRVDVSDSVRADCCHRPQDRAPDRVDVGLETGVLTLRKGKLGKSPGDPICAITFAVRIPVRHIQPGK